MPNRAIIIPVAVVCAIAAILSPDPPTSEPVAHPRVVTKTKIVTRDVRVPVNRPDGYMSRDECERLPVKMSLSDLMWQYGWPSGDNGDNSYTGMFDYPIREDHSASCSVDTFEGLVNSVAYVNNN